MEALRSRINHWRQVLAPAWRSLIVIPIAALGPAAFLRDEFFSPETAAKLKMPIWLPGWAWQTWVTIALAASLFLVLEGSYRIARRASEESENPATEALLAHTKELRLQREAHERENSPIGKLMRQALDPDFRRNRSASKETEPVTPKRAPLKQTVARAGELGWDVTGKTNFEIMTLLSGIRQAALDGEVRMWGRQDRNSAESLKRKEPLIEIERSHWKDFEIDVHSVLSSEENLDTRSYNMRVQRDAGFIDLHLDALATELWLLGVGQNYKNTHKG